MRKLICTLLLAVVTSAGSCAEPIEDTHDEIIYNIPKDFDATEALESYGLSYESQQIINVSSSDLLRLFAYNTEKCNMEDFDSVVTYLNNLQEWVDRLWVTDEFADSYLQISERCEDGIGAVLVEGNNVYNLRVDFDCVIDMLDYPTGVELKEPTVETHRVDRVKVYDSISNYNVEDWKYLAHTAGFSPSEFSSVSVDEDLLYKFFYCHYDRRYKSKEAQVLSTLFSLYNAMGDWSLTVGEDYVCWKIDNAKFTLKGTNPDAILSYKDKFPEIINNAYPTDKINLYKLQYDREFQGLVPIVENVGELDVKKIKDDKVKEYPQRIKNCFGRILALSELYDLQDDRDIVGFYSSLDKYMFDIDMKNGLYNCAVESIGNSEAHIIVNVSYKYKRYQMVLVYGDTYYDMEVILDEN